MRGPDQIPSADNVAGPATPVAMIPKRCWSLRTAVTVVGPNWPMGRTRVCPRRSNVRSRQATSGPVLPWRKVRRTVQRPDGAAAVVAITVAVWTVSSAVAGAVFGGAVAGAVVAVVVGATAVVGGAVVDVVVVVSAVVVAGVVVAVVGELVGVDSSEPSSPGEACADRLGTSVAASNSAATAARARRGEEVAPPRPNMGAKSTPPGGSRPLRLWWEWSRRAGRDTGRAGPGRPDAHLWAERARPRRADVPRSR